MGKENTNVDDFSSLSDQKLFEIYSKNQDMAVRNELIERNYYIAKILAKKYVNKGIEYEDILQVASLGLVYAVERFDVDKGFAFSSFATPTIIGEIKKYFRDKGWQIRVPRRIQELSGKVKVAKVELEQTLGKTPKVSDIANFLDVSEEEVLEAMDASMAYSPTSLDLQVGSSDGEGDTVLHQLIGEDDANFEAIENEDFMKNITQNLDEREKMIISGRYFENKTQMEIADELGVSQMTVSRLEKKILEKLRKEYVKQTNG